MSRVRIVGGEWRSRLLSVAQVPGLRPTPDRVRETLFNWLGQDLSGWRCLDLFAGSGVMGFEAASRGAERVTLVERDPRAFAELERNAKTLMSERLELVRGDALKFAADSRTPYDLVLLDPPYRQGWLEKVAPFLPRLLRPDGFLYVEAEQPVASLGGWTVVKAGMAGQVHYQLLKGDA